MDFSGQQIKTYTLVRMLGSGSFASVFEALDSRDNSLVAIKIIAQKTLAETKKLQELIKTEVNVLRSCNNINVIKYVDSFETKHNFFIVTQFCNGGELQGYLKQKQKFSQNQAVSFLKQILNGFKGLHEVGAMHRDLKLANVLLHDGICKIADLGFAKQLTEKDMAKTVLGTSLTMAPEVLEQKQYGFEADIWSLGVIFYQMLYGDYPFKGRSDPDMIYNIKNNKVDFSKGSINISNEAKQFITECLTIDPSKRIKWKEIYAHPLIREAATKPKGFISSIKGVFNFTDNQKFYDSANLDKTNVLQTLIPFKKFAIEQIGEDDIRKSQNIVAMRSMADGLLEQQRFSLNCESKYLQKRNDLMFITKYVGEKLPRFQYLRVNHGYAMYILLKKQYIDMREFEDKINKKKDIFNISKKFDQYSKSQKYAQLHADIVKDLEDIDRELEYYKAGIGLVPIEIKNELESKTTARSSFEGIVYETSEGYLKALGKCIPFMKSELNKDSLLRAMEALIYYKNNAHVTCSKFEEKTANTNMAEFEVEMVSRFIEN